MDNGLFKIGLGDIGRGVAVAVAASVAVYLLAILNAPGFSFNAIDFAEIARIALASGLGYIVKNLLTDNQGNLLAVGSHA